MKEIGIVPVKQPIGTFYLTSLPAETLFSVTVVDRRTDGGIQRDESTKRITDIADYCHDTDATFPTPIIIAVKNNDENDQDFYTLDTENNRFRFDDSRIIGEIIDGQHRVKGIKKSNIGSDFELPVVLMFNLIEEEKAYVFSIINSKQTKVSASLIYDLFDLHEGRSPQKTCHEVARLLNKDEKSPFYRRLKMLGKKERGDELASLSQGSFVKYLLLLISKNPDDDWRTLKREENLTDDPSLPLRYYFINNRDEIIVKLLFNLFSALSDETTFEKEWNDPNNFIISKTVGFGAIMKAFAELYKIGANKNTLTKEFFLEVFVAVKGNLAKEGKELTSEFFPSNAQNIKVLSDFILASCAHLR